MAFFRSGGVGLLCRRLARSAAPPYPDSVWVRRKLSASYWKYKAAPVGLRRVCG